MPRTCLLRSTLLATILLAPASEAVADFTLGFTAGTGGARCTHAVDNLRVRPLACTEALSLGGAIRGSTGSQGVRIRATLDGLQPPLTFAWEVLSGQAEDRTTALPSEVLVLASVPGVARVGVTVVDGAEVTLQAEHAITFEVSSGGVQMPVDCNQDGAQDMSDAICILGHLFLGAPGRLPCGDGSTGDRANQTLLSANGDELVDLSDAVYLLSFLFLGGPQPAQGLSCIAIEGCPERCGR